MFGFAADTNGHITGAVSYTHLDVYKRQQKQRTAIARALVTRPAIILADEPTGNLDSQTELEVMSLLKSCVSDFGQTLIMITHDETIAQMADEMIIIEDGKAVRR